MPKSVIAGKALISVHGNGVDKIYSALKNETQSLFPTSDYIGEEFGVKHTAITPWQDYSQSKFYSDFCLREKIQHVIKKLFIEIAPSLRGIKKLDALYLLVGTSEYRALYDKSGFCFEQSVWINLILHELKTRGIELKHESCFYLSDNVCASSSVAIGVSSEKITNGLIKNSLILALDLVTFPVLAGLDLLGALSKHEGPAHKASRPFSQSRSGFVRAEALGALLLENEESARQRGVSLFSHVQGYGHSSDAKHVTAGCEKSLGIISSMKQSLQNSGLHTQEIGVIKAHGTGTILNDKNEARGIESLFSDTPVISFKGQFGHTAASSGLFETLLSECLLMDEVIYRSWNCEDFDSSLGINVIRENLAKPKLDNILMNAFGFGGNNCSLILSRVNPTA